MEKEGVGQETEVERDRAPEVEVATVPAQTAEDAEDREIEMAPGIHNEDESTARKENKVAADRETEAVSTL